MKLTWSLFRPWMVNYLTYQSPITIPQDRPPTPVILDKLSLVWSGLVWSGLVWSGLVWSGLPPSQVRTACQIIEGLVAERTIPALSNSPSPRYQFNVAVPVFVTA